MRWMFLSVCLAASGCFFVVDGEKPESGQQGVGDTNDLATGDVADLGAAASDDLAGGATDLASAAASTTDLAAPFTPSHVSPDDFQEGTAPLTVTQTIR